MAQVITLAAERLFALKAQNNQQLDIDTFIFAYVPGQDSTAPIDRNEDLPPVNQRVHQQIVQQYGMLNDNAVVYSSVLDSLTGPFQFNWVGLYSAVNQTLVAIQHIPTVVKTVTEPGASGNILNRNFVIEYSGIAELTGITVDPATWQYDFNARLNGMDELTRQLAADMNGKDWFIGDGFKVVPRSTLNTFKVTAGAGYVSGLRVELAADHILTLSSYPQFVYVDAWFDGTSESVWRPKCSFTITNVDLDDYIDVHGRSHFVHKIARLNSDSDITDLRGYVSQTNMSYMRQDYEAFTDDLLAAGGIADNGHPDTPGNSKKVKAIKAIPKEASTITTSSGRNAQSEIDGIKTTIALTNDTVSSVSARVIENANSIAALQDGQTSSVVGFATQSELFASITYDAGTIAYVTNDPYATKNGTYIKLGASGAGSWQQSASDLASQAYQKSTANESSKADKSQIEFESLAPAKKDRLYLIDNDNRIMATIEDTDKMFRPVDFESTMELAGLYVLDADNRVLASTETSSPVIDTSLSDQMPKFGAWYLRETRQRTRKLLLGEVQKLSILMIGDSWTHLAARYSGNLGLELQKSFGGTSAGFTGFSWGFGTPPTAGWNTNFDPSTTSTSITGAWVAKYGNQTSPDICAISSAVAGDSATIATSRSATSAVLFANNNSAQIRYKYNSGPWNALTLSGAFESFTLETPPDGSFSITFEVVSGTCELYGVNLTNNDSGVIIHKVGATGTQLAAWAAQSNNAEWQANISALAPNLITILHGTNDQNNYTAAQFKVNGQTLINNIRSALPLCDILLISPCENGRSNTVPMSAYQHVTQQLAYENKCAFLNLQHFFGEYFSEYASTSPRNWFNADLIHPEPSTGGRVILDAVYKIIAE